MVSDVIFDALENIKEYEIAMPDVYLKNKVIAEKVKNLKEHMLDVQMFLDVYTGNVETSLVVGKYTKPKKNKK